MYSFECCFYHNMLAKKIISFILIIFITCTPALAAKKAASVGNINHEFSMYSVPEQIQFKITEDFKKDDEFIIPSGSVVTAKVCESQKEKRWHKSGFIICKVISYRPEDSADNIDISEKEQYIIVRKHEPIDGKEAAILTTEIILTQAASIVGSCFIIFAPVDIAYFFTKGAIQREKHHNWFKAGVFNAYDNSIFWFWLKGKPIDLEEGDDIKFKDIKKAKAEKVTSKIIKKKEKQEIKSQKAMAKANKKLDKYELKCKKKNEKIEKKIAKYELKCKKKNAKIEKKLAKQKSKTEDKI